MNPTTTEQHVISSMKENRGDTVRYRRSVFVWRTDVHALLLVRLRQDSFATYPHSRTKRRISMTDAAAEQPTLDLGDYRGKKIKSTSVKLANANDGFDPSTTMEEPRVYELGERMVLAVEVVVSGHNPKAIDLDADDIAVHLTQTFKAGLIAVVPRRAVAKELNAAQRAKDEAAKAKEAGKKPPRVRRGTLRSVGSSIEEALQGAGESPPAE